MINMVLRKQLEIPVSRDWGNTCKKDLEELGINLNFNELRKLKEETFGKLIKKRTEEKALDYLAKLKQKYSKVRHIVHPKMEIQSYLEASDLSVHEAKFLFALRSRMIDVRTNYREKYFLKACPCCQLTDDTQEHLLDCYVLEEEGTMVDELPQYDDLFGANIEKQTNIARILRKKFSLRNKKENHFQ